MLRSFVPPCGTLRVDPRRRRYLYCDKIECLLRVNRIILTMHRPLPVFADCLTRKSPTDYTSRIAILFQINSSPIAGG
jgi:hypothetical protein